jgi:transposase InsO family protein
LQDKSETQGTLKRFLRRAQNEFELKVKKIRSDNRSEFKNLQVEEYLEEEGIKHKFSAPYTPQQNGVVERKNRTVGAMLHRRRSCRKKQLRLKLLVRDAEGAMS